MTACSVGEGRGIKPNRWLGFIKSGCGEMAVRRKRPAGSNVDVPISVIFHCVQGHLHASCVTYGLQRRNPARELQMALHASDARHALGRNADRALFLLGFDHAPKMRDAVLDEHALF